uniref:Uncharacterized protein n=1 Tax=Panagrolaimus superbus TaxID=310955 RepID=A0A914YE58_9BILA
MLRYLSLWIFAATAIGLTISAKVPICNGLRYSGALIKCGTEKAFYSYGFDLSVSINPKNSTFPNQLRITNFESWSIDPLSIYHAAPLIFPFNQISNQCSSINGTCLLDFPNGATQMLYPLMVNGTIVNYGSNAIIFINNGNIFDGYYGGLLDPIAGKRLGWDDPYCPVKHQQSAICTNFYYIHVPEENYGSCMNFKSVTKITDSARNTTVSLNAEYLVTLTGFNVTVTNFTSSIPGSSYIYGPNIHYWQGAGGNTTNPAQSFPLQFGGQNYQIEWTLDANLPGYYGYGKVITGELIRRNGIFYKDDSIPYTVSDPCFKLTYAIPYYNNVTVETEFCCTLFASN